MFDEIIQKIKEKEQEIDDFVEEQRQYDGFDFEKKDELDKELKLLNEQLLEAKKILAQWEEKVLEIPICKRCNKKMVLRKASTWWYTWKVFYWCVNFPDCRNIVQLISVKHKENI